MQVLLGYGVYDGAALAAVTTLYSRRELPSVDPSIFYPNSILRGSTTPVLSSLVSFACILLVLSLYTSPHAPYISSSPPRPPRFVRASSPPSSSPTP